MNKLLLILLLCFIIINLNCYEGYMNNSPPKDHPDDMQFYACHDYSNDEFKGNNNYKLIKHGISKPLKGAYSYFLDEYKLRDYDEIFHSPICQKHYSFKEVDSSKPNTFIIDHTDITNLDELLKQEENYDKISVKDPSYVYRKSGEIAGPILYDKDIQEMFLRVSSSTEEEKFTQRLDADITP